MATDEVLRHNPKLANDPEGPLTAALIAKGLLAHAGGNAGASPEQKVAAAAPPASAGPVAGAQTPEAKLEALQKEYGEVLQELRNTRDEIKTKQLWARRGQLASAIEGLKKQMEEK